MKNGLKQCIYNDIIEHPSFTDQQIADRRNISRSTVYRIRTKFLSALDYALAQKVAGKFLAEFHMASEYFKLQIERLEALKEKKKTILVKSGDNVETREVDLDPMEILAIEKQQAELWKNILFLARQGEAVEVMRLIQNGRIPTPTATRTESRTALSN